NGQPARCQDALVAARGRGGGRRGRRNRQGRKTDGPSGACRHDSRPSPYIWRAQRENSNRRRLRRPAAGGDRSWVWDEAMRLLLDTHALLWWLEGNARLGKVARAAVARSDARVWVSAATVWEIAIKVGLGRLDLGEPPKFAFAANATEPVFSSSR